MAFERKIGEKMVRWRLCLSFILVIFLPKMIICEIFEYVQFVVKQSYQIDQLFSKLELIKNAK